MKDKIIFWLDADLTHFCLAKFLEVKYSCDLFTIIDITNKPKKFFQTQPFVHFQKVWFYHDHILKAKKKPDLKYLTYIEEKYKINLWLLACNERLFYGFNEFYKFSGDEILAILEQECRLFEAVLDEVKPDFLIMLAPNLHQNELFYEICRARGIKILLLGGSRFGYRCIISSEVDRLDCEDDYSSNKLSNRTLTDLQNYLRGHSTYKQAHEFHRKFIKSKIRLVKAAIKFLTADNSNSKTHYTYYGRTKMKVLVKSLVNLLKSKYRGYFINKNFIRQINSNEPFIFFPLHTEPERSLLLDAPFHTEQIELIRYISKSMPIGYKLFVKEHPSMISRDWRSISYYKQIMNFPNVKLIHPSAPPAEIMKKCSLVITINGTAGLEAAFYEKPTIVFDKVLYSKLSSVYTLKQIGELPEAIKSSLKKKIDLNELNLFVDLVDENSFEFDWNGFGLKMMEYFYYDGFLVDVDIPIPKMKSFLEKYHTTLEQLASEHIKKINQYKEKKHESTKQQSASNE